MKLTTQSPKKLISKTYMTNKEFRTTKMKNLSSPCNFLLAQKRETGHLACQASKQQLYHLEFPPLPLLSLPLKLLDVHMTYSEQKAIHLWRQHIQQPLLGLLSANCFNQRWFCQNSNSMDITKFTVLLKKISNCNHIYIYDL